MNGYSLNFFLKRYFEKDEKTEKIDTDSEKSINSFQMKKKIGYLLISILHKNISETCNVTFIYQSFQKRKKKYYQFVNKFYYAEYVFDFLNIVDFLRLFLYREVLKFSSY